ncbi:MAG: Thioredoxin-like protein [Parcubacteria group bacterium GW2011_GWA2_47_7]|nr:MAG: Thioredoxin-like protein [Parcubacteria group bacterium GW2011_GWA2_47_7]
MEQVATPDVITINTETPPTVEGRVNAVIAKVRPYIQSHGGDVWVGKIEDGILTLRIEGSCAQCPLASLTYNKVVKTLLNEEVPEITGIVLT